MHGERMCEGNHHVFAVGLSGVEDRRGACGRDALRMLSLEQFDFVLDRGASDRPDAGRPQSVF
jgi:hypothetical protein